MWEVTLGVPPLVKIGKTSVGYVGSDAWEELDLSLFCPETGNSGAKLSDYNSVSYLKRLKYENMG
jgi:hypothetical protein